MAPPLSAGLMMIVSLPARSALRAFFSVRVLFLHLGAVILVLSTPNSLILITVSKLLGPMGGIQLELLFKFEISSVIEGANTGIPYSLVVIFTKMKF